MKLRRRPRRQPALVYALYLNAGLLLALIVVILSRGNGPGNAAYGAPQMQPIAGGGGVFLMPAQFSTNTWGCYILDIDTQNLCAYQYLPGANQLRFVAARNFREDRKLKEWNTSPSLAAVAQLNQMPQAGIRGAPAGPGNGLGNGQAVPGLQDQPLDNGPPKLEPLAPATGPTTVPAEPAGGNGTVGTAPEQKDPPVQPRP
jgi:hypothetical protein